MAASAPVLEVVLPRLVNELVEQGEVALVLDDFHRLSSPATRETVAWFVEHLPATTQLVISTRTDPALPLGTLRARGQLLELRADDLRFTGPEAAEFLTGRLGLELEPTDVELLVARTEGWPAGIYLAALSLAGAADRHALVARVRRDQRAYRRLPRGRGPRGPCARAADVHAAHVGARAAVRAALRRGPRGRRVGGRAGAPGPDEPLPRPARRPPALVPLPPPLRADPAGRARAARARSRPGPAPPGVRVARRARDDRRGDPPRRRRRGVRRGRGADRRDVGPLRQRRADRVGRRVARALSAGSRRRRRAAAARAGVGRRRSAAARTRCAPPPPGRARSAGWTRVRCPTGSSRSPRACRCSTRRSAGATWRRSSSTASGRPRSRVPSRRGGR